MSATPKRHQFRSLKSPKIVEKSRLEKYLLKNDKKCLQITFLSNVGSPLVPRGGSANALFRVFFNFGPSWGPNASRGSAQSPQNHPRPPFLLIFGSLLNRFLHFFDTLNAKGCRKKNAKKGQHSVLFLKIFWCRNSRHSTEFSPSPAGHF